MSRQPVRRPPIAARLDEVGPHAFASLLEGGDNDFHELLHARQAQSIESRRSIMTLCPIALAVSCKKCPAFSVCPLKGVVGDFRKEEETPTKHPAEAKDKK